jgi:hypothetical protein
MVRIHLVSMLDVFEMLRNVKSTWAKQTPDKPKAYLCFRPNQEGGAILNVNEYIPN